MLFADFAILHNFVNYVTVVTGCNSKVLSLRTYEMKTKYRYCTCELSINYAYKLCKYVKYLFHCVRLIINISGLMSSVVIYLIDIWRDL